MQTALPLLRINLLSIGDYKHSNVNNNKIRSPNSSPYCKYRPFLSQHP